MLKQWLLISDKLVKRTYETVSYNNEVNKSSTVDLRTIKVKSLACKQNAITPFQIQTDSELSI